VLPLPPQNISALPEKFSGCLLGGMVGDVIGAAVEAESPGYIRKTFQSLDDILALKSVPELITGEWEVGLFTDDTQMTLAVAEWLASGDALNGKTLLTRFVQRYEPWRHYGSGTRLVLESFHGARDNWQALATAMFPHGFYGNGSAMRAAPIGLFLHNDMPALLAIARASSVVTHSHPLAIRGAALQATAVALATRGVCEPTQFLRLLSVALAHFAELGEDTSVYKTAIARISAGSSKRVPPSKMVQLLGNGIKAQEAVPMAIYCFLAAPSSFEKALGSAIFLGGDTDTIGSMTGAIAGAAVGENEIPKRWLQRVTEAEYTPARVRQLALDLYRKGQARNFRAK
jgi:poly(ADP-ribose) glycohydrolase ARH3